MKKVYKLMILVFTIFEKSDEVLKYKIKLAQSLGVKIGKI